MKNLLTVTAVIELGAGLVMLALPSLVIVYLFGSALSTPVELVVARMGGVALLALGVACWFARDNGQSRAAKGLAGAMGFYNAGVVAVLVYAAIGLGLFGALLWPAVLLHAAMTVWCIMCLRQKPRKSVGHAHLRAGRRRNFSRPSNSRSSRR